MEAYANALTYAIPMFFLLIVIEYGIGKLMGKDVYRGYDTISSLSSGTTNTLKNLIGLSIVLVSYDWLVDKLAIVNIGNSVWVYVVAFVGMDFAAYWSHRFNHKINLFWNRHITHHSSEEFNLACALRQSISDIVGIYFFLYLPLAFVGIPVQVVGLLAPIHFFAQFWYHTRLIDRMGPLEYVLMTPSHHRVHHAINDVYIDKNLGAIFIFWDKLFDTFQEEIPEIPPVYGVKKPVKTWNPVTINYIHMWQLIQDAYHAKNWKDKFLIWFKPTGWRPEDVEENYPLKIIKNPYQYKKYDTKASDFFHGWSWFQLGFHIILLSFLLAQYPEYSKLETLLICLYSFLGIIAFTELMNLSKLALPFDILKTILGFGIIYQFNGWLVKGPFVDIITYAVILYMIVSLVITFLFSKQFHMSNKFSILGGYEITN